MNGKLQHQSDARDLPIGIFDSGLGGLTVAKAVKTLLPAERIIYLGDNARVPYGTRSASTVERYARNCSRFLLGKGLKLLVVACNTVSAVALPAIRGMTDIPVMGVISAGARAVAVAGSPRIGVIGTSGTIGSMAYVREIGKLDPACEVYQQAAPLFVPLAEEGWIEGEVPLAVARRYLQPLVQKQIEVLLLGCTHYPLLAATIRQSLRTLESSAYVVDSATAMAADVKFALESRSLERIPGENGELRCFATDLPSSFQEVATRFLGEQIGKVEAVDIS